MARALARDPKVLLLDEPFSAVDKVTRRKLYRELAELRQQLHTPMVLVTHDLEEAALLADRMCILHHGRTLQTAPPFDLMAHPASVAVARLIDLKNVFDGAIDEHRPESNLTLLRWGSHLLEMPLQPGFALGQPVSWCIPTTHIILHRRDRPSRGERENPVPGEVSEFVTLGDNASVAIRVDGHVDDVLLMSVPVHVARRNAVALGAKVIVSLLSEGIHLMPAATSEQATAQM
jgi:molybdate transport system ATP-binding protein